MRKLFVKIHFYLSLPFGVIISIICMSGALMVFEDEIMKLSHRDLFYVDSVSDNALPFDGLLAVADSVTGHDRQITGLTVYNDRQRTYKVSFLYPDGASAYINPYNGDFLGYNERMPFFRFLYNLHRWLLDERTDEIPYTIGRRIVGVSVLVMLFILLSGLLIWIPRNVVLLKNRLSVCTSKGLRRFLFDLHISVGFYSFFILLVLAVTGLTWSFPMYRSFVYKTFGDGPEMKFDLSATGSEKDRSGIYMSWDKAFPVLKNRFPDNDITFTFGQANIHHAGWGNNYAFDVCLIDEKTGDITTYIPYSEKNISEKIKGWILSLHLGLWGGLTGKVITFIAGLIGAVLPLTGYYMWYVKRMRPRQRKVK